MNKFSPHSTIYCKKCFINSLKKEIGWNFNEKKLDKFYDLDGIYVTYFDDGIMRIDDRKYLINDKETIIYVPLRIKKLKRILNYV